MVPIDPACIGYITLGLLGSAQCIGTCGSHVLSLAPAGGTWQTKSVRLLQYGMGRMVAYTALGALAGFLGYLSATAGYLAPLNTALHLATGLLLVTVGLLMVGISKRFEFVTRIPGLSWLKQPVVCSGMSRQCTGWGSIRVGFVSGLAISPLVLIVLAYSFASGTPQRGMLVMALFGLGTGPALLWLGASGYLIGPFIRVRVLALTGILMLIFSAAAISRTFPLIRLHSPNDGCPAKPMSENELADGVHDPNCPCAGEQSDESDYLVLGSSE